MSQTAIRHLLATARGDAPADLLLRGGRVVDVFNGRIVETDVAICGDRIAGLGSGYEAAEVVDLDRAIVCPGFLDAHVHVESAMVPPARFGEAVLPHGVTTVVADPHEIGNVLGVDGIRFMIADAARSPLDVIIAAPSCVPPTELASSGAALGAEAMAELRRLPGVGVLGEMMSYPAVVAGERTALEKIAAFEGLPRDGHCPGLAGADLCAYVAAGLGSDHECTDVEEARRKLSLGMTVFIREGTAARNLAALLPLIDPRTAPRLCWCTDDRTVPDLLERGSIDGMIRDAVAAGVDPLTAIRMATLSPAEHFGLDDRGAVAPGRRADLVIFDDPARPVPRRVYAAGRLVARDGRYLASVEQDVSTPANTVRIDRERIDLAVRGSGAAVRAIGVVPDQLRTECRILECRRDNGEAVADVARDLLKIAVIERHRASGRCAVAFVQGMGLTRGAIAGTIAHDHHNLVVVGADDRSMLTAAHAVADVGGGLAATDGSDVLACLPLPVAGLMSSQPVHEVAHGLERAIDAARALGSPLADPFMTMSFLTLEVIPSLKLTDRGLVDVDEMRFVSPLLESSDG